MLGHVLVWLRKFCLSLCAIIFPWYLFLVHIDLFFLHAWSFIAKNVAYQHRCISTSMIGRDYLEYRSPLKYCSPLLGEPWWAHHFLLINMLNFDSLFCLILVEWLPNQMLVLKLLVLIFHGDLKRVYVMDVSLLNHNFFPK